MIDDLNLKRIQLLHPKLVSEVINILQEVDIALTGTAKVRVTQTLRTFEEQDDLYAQGRTKKGNIVTNSKSGQSYHNFGLALDYCLIINNKEVSWNTVKDYDGDSISDWIEVAKIFKSHGWIWGGNFKSIIDMPHVEKTFGYNWRDLLKKYQNKDFIEDTKYLNL